MPTTSLAWDNASPYTGEPRSWAHRTSEAGYRTLSIGKLHYRAEEDDTGFPERRIPMYVINGVGDLRGNLLREPQPLRRIARTKLVDVGAGESEYNRYDDAINAKQSTFSPTKQVAQTVPGSPTFLSWRLTFR